MKRKIFYLFPERDEHIYSWQRVHFIDELKRNDIQVHTFNPFLSENIDYETKVIEHLTEHKDKYNLFMTAMNDYELSDSFIKQVKSVGLFTLLICWDNLVIPFFHKRISKYFDIVWLTSRETKYLFDNWGANTLFMPYASNPNVYSLRNTTHINKLLFIGSPHGGRREIISKIASNGINTDVFGAWDNKGTIEIKKNDSLKVIRKFLNYMRFDTGRKCLYSSVQKKILNTVSREGNGNVVISDTLSINGSISFDGMVDSYSSYALSLSITEYLDTYLLNKPLHKLHLRTFEIPMSGGLQITYRLSEIKEYFDEDKEIVLYDSEDELHDKLRFYLDKKREKQIGTMKKNAYDRSVKDHTWINRFSRIFDIIDK